MRTNQAVLIAVLVVVIGGTTWWALHDDSAPAPEDVRKPRVEEMTPQEKRAEEHTRPWPHGLEFDEELRALRSPGPIMDLSSEAYLSAMNMNKVEIPPYLVSVNFENATVKDVTEKLAELGKARGLKVYMYDGEIGAMTADHKFTFTAEQRPFWEIVDLMQAHSNSRVKYYVTSLGCVIGGEAAVQQAQMDAREATAKRLAEADRRSEVLDVDYRPDFSDAHIGSIARNIKSQTNVQVVVDEATWNAGRKMTWQTDQMPLRDALERICEEFGCVLRIRGGRVFLIKP